MHIERQMIQYDGVKIPSIIIKPFFSSGSALIIHGYGGCKEEQLGLACRIAEIGITTCVIDLRGHGENLLNLDNGVLSDVEAAIKYCSQYGKVAAIGHSLGGRLALLSNAEFMIGISPALDQEFSEATQKIMKDLRSYRVRQDSPDKVFDILKDIPVWQSKNKQQTSVLFGSRDVPEIVQACKKLTPADAALKLVEGALHSDIFLLETTIGYVINQLKEWFKF